MLRPKAVQDIQEVSNANFRSLYNQAERKRIQLEDRVRELEEEIEAQLEQIRQFDLLRILSTTGLIRDSKIAEDREVQQILKDTIVLSLEVLLQSKKFDEED
jgi:uncharacterized membrane protein YccC